MTIDRYRAREIEILAYYTGLKDTLLHQRPELKDLSDADFISQMLAVLRQVVGETGYMTETEIDYLINYFK